MTAPIDPAQVLDETPDGVVCIGETGEVLYANAAAERIFRTERGRLAGRLWAELVQDGAARLPRDDEAARRAHAQRARGLREDGTTVELEVSLGTHRADGARYYSAVLRDLSASDRALLATQLAAERDAFLSSAAHQLRAPIQPILTSLQTLEQAFKQGSSAPGDTLPRALRQTLRLGRLVDAILRDAAALEKGKLELDVTTFDLSALVSDVVEDFRLSAPGRRFVFRAPKLEVTVASDRVRVHQILITLLDNAMKYSPRGRPIGIAVDEAGDDLAMVAVTDEGIGIPVAEQERVFAKFYRASNAPDEASGLGLGLYLAESVARSLGGSLSVRSEVDGGSTFVLSLPRSLPPAARAV